MILHPIRGRGMVMLAIAVLFFGLAATAAAQSAPTGNLQGDVKDPSGRVIPSVAVTVVNQGTGLTRNTNTNREGHWIVSSLPAGSYRVILSEAAFQTMTYENIAVEASVTRTVATSLKLGAVETTVKVEDNGALLTTPDTATVSRQFTGDMLVAVPTSTRSFTSMFANEAGVSTDLTPVQTNGNGNVSTSVNGARTTSTGISFNGIDVTNFTSNEGSLSNNISPAPETLQEVKLLTSLYDASVGRSGGGSFQLITKSGTNDYHGTFSWYAQNEKFNANDFFFNKDGIDRPKARRNEGGFTIGGPIVQDRLFFFGGYQRTQALTGFVPTASSITVLPQALQSISGPRTKENLFAAFSQLNPGILTSIPKAQCLSASDRACISDVAVNLFNLINPATGDYIIPAPRGGTAVTVAGTDGAVTGSVGNNPLIRQRNVFPAAFKQDQVTLKLNGSLSSSNMIDATFFMSNFPGYDPFPDPSSLASPVTLKRADKNRTLSISDIHIFSPRLTNELRFGFFLLDNTRVLDDPFLAITNASVGIPNPALLFDQGPGTQRLGHYVGRPGTIMERFSFGGPNDTFNRREQRSTSFSDTLSYAAGRHFLRTGIEAKWHRFNSALPEEQATEFEKFDNFTQLLRGVATEGDTQFGITEKRFRFNDLSLFFADDFKVNSKLTLNLGLRWEYFGWPTEADGRIGNFDPALVTNPDNPLSGFIVPDNAAPTGFAGIDTALAATTKASNRHTMNGQDLNNFAPRLGFAFSPLSSGRIVIRGGYGLFFDRPSAAFINTIFSNYPFLRESEVTFPASRVPLTLAWSQQDPNFPFNQYLPNRIVRTAGANGTYQVRDGTAVTLGADGTPNPTDPLTLQPTLGNIAETFEFRAVDRNLRTPYIHQWNLGVQLEVMKNVIFEARYVGTRGTKLLQATSFTQGYDLNDTNTPDTIFERFNKAYVDAGSPNGALNAGATARARGVGRAFGFANSALGGTLDYNLANGGGSVITFEGRSPLLGFDVPEAILLGNSGYSRYHSAQFSVIRRYSKGIEFNASYTYSRSRDTGSSDPGSTAGGGKPDLPNVGFTAQGNAFNTNANYAPSDFDRPHRFSVSYVYDLPRFGLNSRWARGWKLSGMFLAQSGTPFTIFSPEVVAGTAANYNDLRLGSGGLYRLAFGRPSLCGTLDQLRTSGPDVTEAYFNPAALCSPMSLAGGYPDNKGFGNLGRNVLRGPGQNRLDVGLSKSTAITEDVNVEMRWDVFNVMNRANFANPNSVIGTAGTDFNKITDTVGGPRTMQFAMKLLF